jgi:hypothetical protein
VSLICKRCGLPVTPWRGAHGWKHASGGKLGTTPRARRHPPEPIPRPADDAAAVIALLTSRRETR